eukprot:211389_1
MVACHHCCHATNACCCLKYCMCFLQFILTFLYFIVESMLTAITFVVTLSCFYYHLRWRLFTRLRTIDSSNSFEFTTNTKATKPNIVTTNHSLSLQERNEKQTERSSSSSAHTNIKILSQNLWVHYLAPSPCKSSRLRAFVHFLQQEENHYDILIIQELFALRFGCWIRCNDLEYLVQQLSTIGYIYHTKPSGYLPYFGQNGGVVLFSRFPFIYDDVFKFDESDEMMLRKGFAIGMVKIAITNQKEKYYHLCVGTAHCDPYRPRVILSQMQQFAQEMKRVYDAHKHDVNSQMDMIVGGDFNTRIKALTQGLHDYFEETMSMYNLWSIKGTNDDHVTYRSLYVPKYRVWLAVLSCGLCKLPTLKERTGKYNKGYCLDHILTNASKELVQNISVVDTRFEDVFVSDHLGVELVLRLPN